jgi:hypothetical protein
MIKRKLKNLKLQNIKIKNPQFSQEERQIPLLLPCEILHTKNLKTHKMTRRKIENPRFFFYKNKTSSKVHKMKSKNPFPPTNGHYEPIIFL